MKSSEIFFIAGRAYVTGAHAIVKSRVRDKRETDHRLIFPCMMLIGHAIEVYLKAWLADAGFVERALRNRPFGHDLRALYGAARSAGLPEPDMPPQQSFHDLVESYEVQHGDFSFRYPSEDWEFEVPRVDIVFKILTELDRTVASKLGRAIVAYPDWSIGAAEDFKLPKE